MLLDRAVEQRLFDGAPNLLELQPLKARQAGFYGRGIDPSACYTSIHTKERLL